MYLVCPAGSPPALVAAIDHGADAVYVGFRDQTNARAFPGLNFTEADLRAGIAYAHARRRLVYVALNTYPGPARFGHWQAAVDRAAALGVVAIICADLGVLDYAARHHPDLPRHLSVQGSATTHAA
ncbi:MAG: O2-independent ubiquinone biosynthesis protein UbiU, partial [Pseudomonadota bacterium]|nr:O2-independent ubiquinone biosynthesis protein UbiU [Pseudomonadota bacterium]